MSKYFDIKNSPKKQSQNPKTVPKNIFTFRKCQNILTYCITVHTVNVKIF